MPTLSGSPSPYRVSMKALNFSPLRAEVSSLTCLHDRYTASYLNLTKSQQQCGPSQPWAVNVLQPVLHDLKPVTHPDLLVGITELVRSGVHFDQLIKAGCLQIRRRSF